MLHPRVIRDLCRFPMWLVDGIQINKDRWVAVNGWALPNRGDLSIGEISMNGRSPGVFERTSSPEETARALSLA